MTIASEVSWTDVFVVGIGLDIAGALLLAKGLLLSDRQVLGLSRTYFGFSSDQVVSRVDDRISGSLGVTSLLLGFVAQLIGYAISLASPSNPETSLTRAVFALILAAATIVVVFLIHQAVRPWKRRRVLITIARYNNENNLQLHPYGAHLLAFGQSAHMSPPVEDESQAAYAWRVWRVREIIEGGPPG